jgi:protein-L-isoaspartate(D-aspartate) O-methyltransferase
MPDTPASESEYAAQREAMVANQIEMRNIRDTRVLAAMRAVPRHRFVPAYQVNAAYRDSPLPIGQGQTISQPYIVALMSEMLELKGDERVLEIGTGSGYQAAILGQLAAEVISVERFASLAEEARERLAELAYDNVRVEVGDGSLGWPEEAPYDAIIVTAASPKVPPPLEEQLAEGGRLVVPAGQRWTQSLVRVRREGGRLRREKTIGVAFVPLIGKHGWERRGETSVRSHEYRRG